MGMVSQPIHDGFIQQDGVEDVREDDLKVLEPVRQVRSRLFPCFAVRSIEVAQHLGFWNTARAGSTVLDGYTSATATTYDPPNNNPIDPTWNCRDASNTLVPDGSYKFWAQYAEDNGQGPYTTSGLLWTKGPSPATTTYPNQGANFSNMRVTWTPTVVVVAPTITSLPPPATGLVGTAYDFTVTAAGTPAPTFTASGLPTGLSISSAGVISGMPTAAGMFTGMITAANGVSPDATQAFSIAISAAPPVYIGSVRTEGNNLVLTGTGPANATYHVLTSSDLALSTAEWTSIATNSIDSSGNFNVTVPLSAGVSQSYTRLRVP